MASTKGERGSKVVSTDDFCVLSCFHFIVLLNLYSTPMRWKMNLLIITILDGLRQDK